MYLVRARLRRPVLAVALAGAALIAPATASADDCGIEGTYFSGRAALTVAADGSAASLGSFSAGSEAVNVLRTFTLGHAAPVAATLTLPGDTLSTPVFVRRPDGATAAIAAVTRGQTPLGIVATWIGAGGARVEQVLVPGAGAGTTGNDEIGAATAPDGTLTLAYVVDDAVQVARFGADGTPAGTATIAKAFNPAVGIASDGAAFIVVSGSKSAYRWAPDAGAGLEPIAVPEQLAQPADDDPLQSDGHGGMWLRLNWKLLHLAAGGATYADTNLVRTTVAVDAAGNAVYGHGAKVKTVAPSGTVLSDRKAAGTVKGAGTVEVTAVAVAQTPGARPVVLLSQTRRKRRTQTLVRADATRATIVAKARNFTRDAQLALLADGTTWAVWQDGHATFDQNCDVPTVDDITVQAARVTPHAKRAQAKPITSAFETVSTG
jgi:hypothetical protein